ncbi:expressed unknown protein [Seminavis robusta]|uniref:Uncharacterized protein n=1 Tax=Seminavis robusta TaxID=568900 RepID=A0A9N8DLV1_9STRA|nr:expressed unknown protein [Seminavis robusta]|eukprot:Sro228_g092841.1  (110) ;mRNA; f:87296-87625
MDHGMAVSSWPLTFKLVVFEEQQSTINHCPRSIDRSIRITRREESQVCGLMHALSPASMSSNGNNSTTGSITEQQHSTDFHVSFYRIRKIEDDSIESRENLIDSIEYDV